MRKRGWMMWVVALVLAGGCSGGGGEGSGKDALELDISSQEDVVGVDSSLEDFDPGGHCTVELVLELFNGESPMVLEVGRDYVLQARIYNPLSGDTPEGENVSFTLDGEGDAELLQGEAATDAFGVALVNLNTGTQAPLLYELHIDTPCAPGIDVVVDVQPHATGTILLSFEVGDDVEDPSKISSFGVYVSQVGLLCAAANPSDPAPEMVLHELGPDQTQLLIDDAVVGPGYTIMIVGYDTSSLPVAAGCTEGISVFAGKETAAEVTLGPLQVSPAGTYQITMTPDFAGLTTGPPAALAQHLAAALDMVPTTVPTVVLDGILVWMDDGVLPEQCDDVSVEIDESVAAWVAANTPPAWAAGLQDLATPLDDLLTDPVIRGALVIAGGGLGDACAANLDLETLELSGGGATDLFTEEEFEVGEAWLKADDSEMTCQVTAGNDLLFNTFELHVNPGRILLFGLVNVVLPDAADGATSVVDLFTGFFDCEAMLAGVKQSTLTCINRPMSELVEDCEDAVFAALEDYLHVASEIGAEQVLEVSGQAEMLDNDKDLAADELSGTFAGTWILNGTNSGEVTVPFTAPKQ